MALKVLVTGAAGVLGKRVVHALRSANHDILASGRVAAECVDVPWDLSRVDALAPQCNPDVVVHAAARVGGYQQALSEAGSLFDVNVTGTLRVANWCVERRVKRLVLVSSAIVYGEWTGAPKTEDDPVKPWVAGPYAVSKWCSEQVAWLIVGSGVELRLSSLYGDGYRRGLLQRFIGEVKREGTIFLEPPFDDGFDLLHVSDAARTVQYAVENDKPGIWNVGSGTLVTIQQLAEACARHFDGRATFCDREANRPPRAINWVHDQRARKELGHACCTSLDLGIAKIADGLQGVAED